MIIQKALSYLNTLKWFPFVFITPHTRAIGNCAEDIYFALLKARRERKKVILFYPLELPWKVRFRLPNRALYQINSDYRLFSRENFVESVAKISMALYYFPIQFLNAVLNKFFKKNMKYEWISPTLGSSILWQPKAGMRDFSWDIVKSYKWKEQINEFLPISLREENYELARKIRLKMGLPEDSWFVCIHAREGGFRNDYNSVQERNSDIMKYIPAIRIIVKEGGWVVRLGDNTMKPLPKMDNVIDYPHTKFKSELMDLYLISDCKFFIGTPSGLWDLASMFQKPMITPNMYSWFFTWPPRLTDLGLIRHIYSKKRERFLSVKELLCEPDDIYIYSKPQKDDFVYYENTPEEIRQIVEEFMKYHDSRNLSDLQQMANSYRKSQALKMSDIRIKPNRKKDVTRKYRIASRVEGYAGSLGQRYLEENWEVNIHNERNDLK